MRGAVVAMGAAVVGGCASAPAAVERAPCAAETRAWVERPVLSILPGHRESVVVISGGTLACIGVGDGVVWQGYPAFGEVVEVFGLRSRVRLVHGEGPLPPAPKRVRVWRRGVPPGRWPAEPRRVLWMRHAILGALNIRQHDIV